jgi:hypothetical protein
MSERNNNHNTMNIRIYIEILKEQIKEKITAITLLSLILIIFIFLIIKFPYSFMPIVLIWSLSDWILEMYKSSREAEDITQRQSSNQPNNTNQGALDDAKSKKISYKETLERQKK